MLALNFHADDVLDQHQPLRDEIRKFLLDDPAVAEPKADAWVRYDAGFSRRLGARGFIGMTWPVEYGGQGRSAIERYVVTEEICAAGAPGGAHWGGDRQIGQLFLRHGTEDQRRKYLPKLARAEIKFCLGMSEPDSGSDLASVRTRATPTATGWRISGRKIWTSNAHYSDFVLALCRTAEGAKRHDGLSQIIIPTDAAGVSIRPINNMAGEHEFNEVLFDEVEVPAENLVGLEGNGWRQIGGELALERSGPERFLSTYVLLRAIIQRWGAAPTASREAVIGRLMAHLVALRGMSVSVAATLERGGSPGAEAALVKDLGAIFEQQVIELALAQLDDEPDPHGGDPLAVLLADAALRGPSFSLRGGTREILRGIISRSLGLK